MIKYVVLSYSVLFDARFSVQFRYLRGAVPSE